MTQKMFKKLVHWAGIIVLFRIIAAGVFALFLSGQVNTAIYYEEFSAAERIHLFYQFAIIIIFSIFYAFTERSRGEVQNEFKQLIKSPDFKILDHYKQNYLKEHLLKTALYTVFQLPLTVSVALQGYVVQSRTLLERAFPMDSGAYAVTNSALLGLLLNPIIFGVIFMGTYITVLAIKQRTEKI